MDSIVLREQEQSGITLADGEMQIDDLETGRVLIERNEENVRAVSFPRQRLNQFGRPLGATVKSEKTTVKTTKTKKTSICSHNTSEPCD